MITAGKESMKAVVNSTKAALVNMLDNYRTTDNVNREIKVMDIFEQGLQNVQKAINEAGGIEPEPDNTLKDQVEKNLMNPSKVE